MLVFFLSPEESEIIYAQNANKTNCLCNANDITILRSERENSSLDRCRYGKALLVQDM